MGVRLTKDFERRKQATFADLSVGAVFLTHPDLAHAHQKIILRDSTVAALDLARGEVWLIAHFCEVEIVPPGTKLEVLR